MASRATTLICLLACGCALHALAASKSNRSVDEPGVDWKLIYRQNGIIWAKNKAEHWLEPWPCNPQTVNKACSDLGRLKDFEQEGGGFWFKLVWPGRGEQEWKQAGVPTKSAEGKKKVDGYEAVKTPFTGELWGGLEYNGKQSLYDGSVGSAEKWWFAVGSVAAFGKKGEEIPGPAKQGQQGQAIKKVELYSRCTRTYYTEWVGGTCAQGRKVFNKCTREETRTVTGKDTCGDGKAKAKAPEPTERTSDCPCPDDIKKGLEAEKQARKEWEDEEERLVRAFLRDTNPLTPDKIERERKYFDERFEKVVAEDVEKYKVYEYCPAVGEWKDWGKCFAVNDENVHDGCLQYRNRKVNAEVACGLRPSRRTLPCDCPEGLFTQQERKVELKQQMDVKTFLREEPKPKSKELIEETQQGIEKWFKDNANDECVWKDWGKWGECAQIDDGKFENGCLQQRARELQDSDPCADPNMQTWPCVCPCIKTRYTEKRLPCAAKTGQLVDGCTTSLVREVDEEDPRPECRDPPVPAAVEACACPGDVLEGLRTSHAEGKLKSLNAFYARFKTQPIPPQVAAEAKRIQDESAKEDQAAAAGTTCGAHPWPEDWGVCDFEVPSNFNAGCRMKRTRPEPSIKGDWDRCLLVGLMQQVPCDCPAVVVKRQGMEAGQKFDLKAAQGGKAGKATMARSAGDMMVWPVRRLMKWAARGLDKTGLR